MKGILKEAYDVVYDRQEEIYGHPEENLGRIAKFWSIILGIEVSPTQAGLCMMATKIARELNTHKRDNLIDIAGYSAVIERLLEKPEELTRVVI